MRIAYCIHIRDDWKRHVDDALSHANSNNLTFVDADAYVKSKVTDDISLLTFDDGREIYYPELSKYLRKLHLKVLSFPIMMDTKMSKTVVDWNFWKSNSDVYTVGAHSLTHTKVATSSGKYDKSCDSRSLLPRQDNGIDFKLGLLNREYNPIENRIETIDEFRRRVMLELLLPKHMIERNLGIECKYFAYPWSKYDNELASLVKLAGYKYAFGVKIPNRDMDDFHIPRHLICN